jgi:2-methylisocitrate lyase-like PEP mutase family enzyme
MIRTMSDPARRFRALHDSFFVMPNPWDGGTARLLADLGFAAIATSSAALAWTHAFPDGTGGVTRDLAIAHAQALAEASALPVNGDFESGYGATPAEIAETVRRAADAGVAGCSIEDRDPATDRVHPRTEALRRFEAAKAAAVKSGTGFVLTGRCEVFFEPHPDPLAEAVERLRAYEAAGADVVYAPGLTSEEQVRAVVDAVRVPVNVLGGIGGVSNDLASLARLGVRRVSIGSGLAKKALGAFLEAARALAEGRFDYAGSAASGSLNQAFADRVPRA